MLGDLILESAVSTNSSNIAVHKDQQLSGVVKSLSEIFGDQESRTGYTGISGQVLNKFKAQQKFNNGAPIALSTETLAEIYKFVAVASNTETSTSTTPLVLKGIDNETKQEIKDVDDLIENQISKYESMLKTNKNFAINDKLGYWTREKKMQELLKARLDKHGVDEELKANFKNLYSRKVDILESKAKQGPFDKNNYKAEGNLTLVNSTLTQMATGASRTDLQENRSVTMAIAEKVTEKNEKFIESRESFTELNKKLQDKTLSKTDIKKINSQLKKARKELDISRSEYYKINSLSIRFGLRSAFNFNDTDRAQYTGAIKDIEALDGETDLSQLP